MWTTANNPEKEVSESCKVVLAIAQWYNETMRFLSYHEDWKIKFW